MGHDKRLLPWDIGNSGCPISLLQAVVDSLRAATDEVIVVANDEPEVEGARVVPDTSPGAGSLGGILSGIEAARHNCVFVAAADMPFLQPDLVRDLIKRLHAHDAVVPMIAGRPEPLHTVYGRAVAGAARRQIGTGELKIVGALAGLDVVWVDEQTLRQIDPNLQSFRNVNTPAEYDQARADASGAD
jgi:molybdopterin-guanine dinucleotide biosynthesis protein A